VEAGRKGGIAVQAKGLSVLHQVYKILESEYEARTAARAFVDELQRGNVKAWHLIVDRQEGPVPREVRVQGVQRVKLIQLLAESIVDANAEDRTNGVAP